MKTGKKIIIGVLVTALVAGGTAGAAVYFKKNNQETVSVISVDSLASPYYMDDTMLDGNIVTNVSQNISVDKDMIIQEVYVQKNDAVKKGDKLIAFDMTLVQMELNIAKLKQQKQQQDLNQAINRLKSLKNGGPIETEDGSLPEVNPGSNSSGNSDDEMASLDTGERGNYLAAAVAPLLTAAQVFQSVTEDKETEDAASAFGETQEETEQGSGASQSEMEGIPDQPAAGEEDLMVDFGDGNAVPENPESPEPSLTPTPAPEEEFGDAVMDDMEIIDPDSGSEGIDITDGNPLFYQKLDGDSIPFTGTGTEEDPFVFLCSAAKGSVAATGAFLNKMAGYLPDGTKEEGVSGYWYQLEFHQNDTITNFGDRKESCIGYYLVDGSLLENMVEETAEMEYPLDGASRYEEDPLEPDYGGGGGTETPTISREDAIKIQETKVESLKLDIRESGIEISKLEKKVQNEVIYSKLDGTVGSVGDPVTGASDNGYFMTIKSAEGYYVKGTVSELLLDQVQEGTRLNCSGSTGMFEAEVMDVSDYPVSANSYMGNGNPNVSYYTYSASILDQGEGTAEVSEGDWLSVTLQNQTDSSQTIVLDKAFVRMENGAYYVFKDENGVLKKQQLTVGGSVNGGSSVLIKGGLTREDWIAFPYGDAIQEGAKTKNGTLEELYGY